MKYLKYLFSSMLIAGALSLAGCGSKGNTDRSDGDRNVIKEVVLDREINLDGVIRAHKTGAPMSNVQVTLIQLGKVRSTTTVDTNGHYAFTKVKVASDQGAAGDADNSANTIQFEFKELKTKKLSGVNLVSGSDLYENGTATPSYPESRISFTLVTPDLTDPGLVSADHSADVLAGNTNPDENIELVDAINEGRSYYFVDANTVRIRDVRLVQTGVLTGTTVDSDTGLPVAGAYVTIDTDAYFRSPKTIAGDIVAVWQQTRITASLSTATGAFTFASIPALDYTSGAYAASTIHAEALGYTENTTSAFNDHANIRDDLVGSVGVILLTPIKVTLKSVSMKFVDQNLAALAGVSVVFKYDPTETSASANYGSALANGLATDIRWVATSDASGVATVSVPNIGYNNALKSQDFTAKKTGYKLDDSAPLFSALVLDEDDLIIDLSTFGGVDKAVDLGVIKMIPDTKNFASEFRVQLIHKDAPLVGATVTGIAKYIDPDVSGLAITVLISGDSVSDSNGFITFNTNKIPASAGGLSVTFVFDVSLTGATSIVSALTGTYVADDTDDLDLTDKSHTAVTVFTQAVNGVRTITINDKSLKLAGLEGYIVTGDSAIANPTVGTISFSELADVNLKLKVTVGTAVTSYFTTTDDNGYYAFLATDGVNVPTSTANNLTLELVVLGDFVFSDGAAGATPNLINLEDPIDPTNGVDQIDTDGVPALLGGTAWLWQINEGVDDIPVKYDGKILQIHTAAVEPAAALHLGFHVVSLLKTVAGVNTLSVIESDGTNKVYTYTQSQDDATGIQIIMSGALDETLDFEYNGLTGANLTDDNNTVHRLQIDSWDTTSGNIIPDGQVLTYTATASGRTITIVPSGNANKFETQVTYKLLVRAVNAAGEVSDDFLFFRFYNHENEIFSTEKPSVDVSTMTTGDQWYLRNDVVADADNYKLALNDSNGTFDAGDLHFLLYSNGTGFSFATGGFQTEAFAMNSLKLIFPVPTDLRTGVTANTNTGTVVTELADFEVWAQAYTVGGVILQHWTKVSAASSTAIGNNFDSAFAGKLKVGVTTFGGAPNIFEKALVEGNKVDLTLVHKNSQIDPAAAKCLTLSLTDHAGPQAKTLAVAATKYTVVLSENVNAVAATVPTMTSSVFGTTLTNVAYTAANQIEATAAIVITSAAAQDISVGATSAYNIGTSSQLVSPAAGVSTLLLTTATTQTLLDTYGSQLRVGRNLSFDSDGATVTTSAVNSVITSHSSISNISIPIRNRDYTFANAAETTDVATTEDGSDNSTATAVDVDIVAGTVNISTVQTDDNQAGRTYDIKYTQLTAGTRLKNILQGLKVGDMIAVSGNTAESNWYLRVSVNATATSVRVIEDGNGTGTDIRPGLAYEATGGVSTGLLVITAQIGLTGTTLVSDNTTTGVAEASSYVVGVDATTSFRGAVDLNYDIIDGTTILLAGTTLQLYSGDTVILMTDSATATAGNKPIYSATVTGAMIGHTNTVVTITAPVQLRGTTELFNAGGQATLTNALTDNFIFYGDTATIGLGTGITSVLSGAAFNTNGDQVSTAAFTDGIIVQTDLAEGFNGVK